MSDSQTSGRQRGITRRLQRAKSAALPSEIKSEIGTSEPVRLDRVKQARARLEAGFDLDAEFKMAMHKMLSNLGA